MGYGRFTCPKQSSGSLIGLIRFLGGRWYFEEEIEEYRRDLDSAEAYDSDQIADMCAKLDTEPNKKHRLLMIKFKNGEHRTVLSTGKVLDQKAPPPVEWDIPTLFESLAFKVFIAEKN